MSEIVVKEGSTPKRKKRLPGFVRFLIGFVITILVIVALVVGAVFICFYDNNHKLTNVKDGYENQEVFNEIVVDSLDNTKTSQKINIAITEDQINQLLYNAYSNNTDLNGVIKNFYVEADNGTYNFVMEVDAMGYFRTRLILLTKLEITDQLLTFKVNDVKVGRIGGFQNLVGVIQRFVTIPDVDSALASAGLHMHFDINNLQITYNLNDFYSDLINLMGGDNDYTSIFIELISKQELRTIDAVDKNVFQIDVNVDKLQVTTATYDFDGFSVEEGYFEAALASAKENTVSLLNAGKISSDNAQSVARYMIGGEALLEDSEKTVVNQYKADGVLDDYEAAIPYYDYTENNDENLKHIAQEQIEPQMLATFPLLPDHVEVEFNGDMIEDMFKTSTALGKINVFCRNTGTEQEKNYKLNYMVIDRISTFLKDDHFYFMLSMNFNGCSGQMTLKTTRIYDPSYGFGVAKFRIDDMFLGDIAVSENTKSSFLQIVRAALENGAFDDRFSFDEDGVITLNLKKTLDENGVLEELGYSTTFSIVDAHMDGTNYVPGSIHVDANK